MSDAVTTQKDNSETTETITADTADKLSAQAEVKPGKADAAKDTETGDLSKTDRAELSRLRELHKDEQKWRREATENHRDAEAHRNLLKALGVDGKAKTEFDPQAAFADLNGKFEESELARIRSEVARTESVDPEDFSGRTEDEMRASAKRFKARIEAEVEKRAKAVGPSAAAASEVTANGKVEGAKQVTARSELKKMTNADIIEAHKAGRLDDQIAGRTT